jgi:hypothetical protein
MGIQIPSYLQWVSYLAGQEWPQGDETAMFRIGEDWRSSSGELKDLIPDLNRVRSETESMFSGLTAEKVDQEFAKLFDGDYSVDKLAEAMSALGDLAQGCGTEIEYTKLQIITTLAIAAAEIGFALAASPETFGASLGVIPGIEALTMAAVRQFVSQLLKNIVEHLAEAGLKTVLKRLAVHVIADGLGQELAIQGFQIAEGHRHGLDAKQLENAELSAVVGGAVGAPVSRGVGHALGPAGGRISGAVKGGVSGYAGGVAGNVAGTAATGGPMNATSILGGAVPGGLSGGVHGGRGGHGGSPDNGSGGTPHSEPDAHGGNGSHPTLNGDSPATHTDPNALHGTEPISPPQHETPPHETPSTTTTTGPASPDSATHPVSEPHSTAETPPSAHSGDGPVSSEPVHGTGAQPGGPTPEQAADTTTHPSTTTATEPASDVRQAPSGPTTGDSSAGPSSAAAATSPSASTGGSAPAASAAAGSAAEHAAPSDRGAPTTATRTSLSDSPSAAPTTRPAGTPVAHTSDAAPNHASTGRETSEAPRATPGPDTARQPTAPSRAGDSHPTSEAPSRRPSDDRPSPETRVSQPTDAPRSTPHDQPVSETRTAVTRDGRPSTDPTRPTTREDRPDTAQSSEPRRSADPRHEDVPVRPTSQSDPRHPSPEREGSQRPDAERHPESVGPQDMSIPPMVVTPTLPGVASAALHTPSTDTRTVPLDKPPAAGPEHPAGPEPEAPKPVHRRAFARPPDFDDTHDGHGGPPWGDDVFHRRDFDNPSNHRIYGPHELGRLRDPAHQHAVEDALRDPRGGYTVGADPRTHPYGDLINDGGPRRTGRDINCLDCSLAALASFHGQPTVSVPRYLDRLPNGMIDRRGEFSGLPRAEAWLGEGLHPSDPRLGLPDQFVALHQQIARMGPGSSALVVNTWHKHDNWDRPLYHRDGTPVAQGSHATVIVYPRDAAGPVWWDPQRRLTSDHPPQDLVGRSAYLYFTAITPNHFGPVTPGQGGHHGGTEHSGAGTGLPGDDHAGPARGVPIRDGLGVHSDLQPRGIDTEPGGRTGEAGDRLADRGRDGTSELGAVDDRGGLRSSETRGRTGGSPDLPLSVEDHPPAHPRGPGDHRLSDDRSFPDEPTRTHPAEPADREQADLTERTAGRAVDRGGLLRGVEQPTESRSLAGPGHDGILDEVRPAHHLDTEAGSGHGGEPPLPPHDGVGSHPGDEGRHDDPDDRWRHVEPYADGDHARLVANDALAHRIPPAEPIELRHPLGDGDVAKQRANDNARWWKELDGEQQRALIDAYPHEIGNSEGIPPSARHEANSSVLEHDRAHLQARKDAGDHLNRSEHKYLERLNGLHGALEKAKEGAAKLGGGVHILAFDPLVFHGDGRMVVSVGHDPHHADSVSWHVPGFSTTIDSLHGNLENALHHLESTQLEKPGITAAAVAWIGYDAPNGMRQGWRVAFQGLARTGGAILHSDLAAFNAGRDVAAGDGSHFTNNHVFGHSYGSTTTGHAGREGRMAGDIHTVTLLGSPGAGPQRHASDFGIGDHVFVASSSRDPVTMLGGRTPDSVGRFFGHGLGMDPAMREFGAHRITSEFPRGMDRLGTVSTHTAYYHFDPESGLRSESLANFGRIAAGKFDEVHYESPRTVDDRPRWIPGWRTDEPAMGRPLENATHHPDSLERQLWDPHWHSGHPQTDPVHSHEPSGDGWHRTGDKNDIDPHYGQPLDKHWIWPDDPTARDHITPDVLALVHDRNAPFGRDAAGNPYTQRQYEESFNTLGKDDAHWMNFPGNDGAVSGTKVRFTEIQQFVELYGRSLDRIGDDKGAYLGLIESGRAASWEERALHLNSLAEPYSSFTLEHLPAGWEIEISEIAPGLGQPGGGIQVRIFDDGGQRKSVRELVDPDGYTRPILRKGIV